MESRAKNVTEVEYEVLSYLRDKVNVEYLKDLMVDDKVSLKRWDAGVHNVCTLLDNMCNRRLHRLPKEHPDYKGKV